jgi:hypothetical protein
LKEPHSIQSEREALVQNPIPHPGTYIDSRKRATNQTPKVDARGLAIAATKVSQRKSGLMGFIPGSAEIG